MPERRGLLAQTQSCTLEGPDRPPLTARFEDLTKLPDRQAGGGWCIVAPWADAAFGFSAHRKKTHISTHAEENQAPGRTKLSGEGVDTQSEKSRQKHCLCSKKTRPRARQGWRFSGSICYTATISWRFPHTSDEGARRGIAALWPRARSQAPVANRARECCAAVCGGNAACGGQTVTHSQTALHTLYHTRCPAQHAD